MFSVFVIAVVCIFVFVCFILSWVGCKGEGQIWGRWGDWGAWWDSNKEFIKRFFSFLFKFRFGVPLILSLSWHWAWKIDLEHYFYLFMYFYWLFECLICTLIVLTTQSSHVCSDPMTPTPRHKQKRQFHFVLSIYSVKHSQILSGQPSREDDSYSVCICTRRYQMEENYPLVSKAWGQFSCEGQGRLSRALRP